MKRKTERKIIIILTLAVCFTLRVFSAESCEHVFELTEEPATCEESGYQGYVCSLCSQRKDFVTVPQLGHLWSEWEVQTGATCTSKGLQVRSCCRCKKEQEEVLPKLDHDYGIWIQKPTCGRAGYTLHTCKDCGHEEKTDRVEALGHDLSILTVAPTCTKDGYTSYHCTRCTYSRKEDLIEKTGHLFDSGTVEKEAGLHASGRIRYTCLNCSESKTQTIPQWQHPFVDVPKNAYFEDSITWAYHIGITTGTDTLHFSPDATCTRAQVVTFLWRWAGSPEPKVPDDPFVDVEKDSFYAAAVLWAVEKGITNGVDATHFAPGQNCTRSQVVTLIHRYLGCPFVEGNMPFEDVDLDAYFAQAVLWAYKNKITTGVDTTHFVPNGFCNRGQIVTFLYRASNE